MKVFRGRMVEILQACGVATAADWDEAKLLDKVAGGLEKYGEGVDLDESIRADFDRLVQVQRDGGTIEIVPDAAEEAEVEVAAESAGPPETEIAVEAAPEPVAAPRQPKARPDKKARKAEKRPPARPMKKQAAAPAKPKKAAKPRGPGRPAGATGSYAELLKFRRKHPQRLTGRGPGVVKAIVDLLTNAGRRGKPITKAAIHAKLVEMFPDRDPAKMMTTVNNRVPTYLNKIMGMGVVRDLATGGYYIPPQ